MGRPSQKKKTNKHKICLDKRALGTSRAKGQVHRPAFDDKKRRGSKAILISTVFITLLSIFIAVHACTHGTDNNCEGSDIGTPCKHSLFM